MSRRWALPRSGWALPRSGPRIVVSCPPAQPPWSMPTHGTRHEGKLPGAAPLPRRASAPYGSDPSKAYQEWRRTRQLRRDPSRARPRRWHNSFASVTYAGPAQRSQPTAVVPNKWMKTQKHIFVLKPVGQTLARKSGPVVVRTRPALVRDLATHRLCLRSWSNAVQHRQ